MPIERQMMKTKLRRFQLRTRSPLVLGLQAVFVSLWICCCVAGLLPEEGIMVNIFGFFQE